MIYKPFEDLSLSALGMGCMRLPQTPDGKIDESLTEKMLAYAMENGVNYYDTAWGYHGGDSELVMGKLLAKYPRDSFYLASKFPGYDLSNFAKKEEVFERQLEKCRVSYFDFYLFHNVCEKNIDEYLDNAGNGLFDYLVAKKKAGIIRHLGFSTHGTLETMKRFLDAYASELEFCQIQLNYLDWHFQNAKEKIALLKEYNLPVFVMEPVRGGKLASLEEPYAERLKALRPNETQAGWAFRFLQTLEEPVVTLSGMSNEAQLKENIRLYSEEAPLSHEEMTSLLAMALEMTGKGTLPCTACRYCTSYCPMGLDIPYLIELYNEHLFSEGGFLAPMAIEKLPENKRPTACVGCHACEKVCPQNIGIPAMMADFAERLGLKK